MHILLVFCLGSLQEYTFAMSNQEYERERQKKLRTIGIRGNNPTSYSGDYSDMRVSIPSSKDPPFCSKLEIDPKTGEFYYIRLDDIKPKEPICSDGRTKTTDQQ